MNEYLTKGDKVANITKMEVQSVGCAVEKLGLKPGDMLVLKIVGDVSTEALDSISVYMEMMLKRIGLEDKVGMLVVEKGFELKLVRLAEVRNES